MNNKDNSKIIMNIFQKYADNNLDNLFFSFFQLNIVIKNLNHIFNKFKLSEINLTHLSINLQIPNNLYFHKKEFEHYLEKLFLKSSSLIK